MPHFPDEPDNLTRQKQALLAAYPSIWNKVISEWNAPSSQDRAWLLYSANYLFRTAGTRWALDPLTLKQRLPDAPEVDVTHDLERLSFVLLTHRHADHLDLRLVQRLSTLPILWVVPEPILSMVEQAGLSREHILTPRPLESIKIQGILITPFDGLHWENDSELPDGLRGVPAMGYLVEFGGKRWLFPGDVRTYTLNRLPSFDALEGAFVHLWLGRASALLDQPPLLESFGRFCMGLKSTRIIISHLQEFGRMADEFWNDRHFQQVKQWLQGCAPDIKVEFAEMGCSIDL